MEHPVLSSLRNTLTTSRTERQLAGEVGGRIHQLISGMVDGRVLPAAEADALRAGIYAFIRTEALPTLAKRDPDSALRLLQQVAAFEPWTRISMADERQALEGALSAKYPPPTPHSWPVLERLNELAARAPKLCSVRPPVQSSAFARTLKEDGATLPAEVVGLYGTFDGFDLNSASVPSGESWTLPVFALLGAASLDVCDPERGWPRRVAVFQGGDEVQLCVYSDRKKAWWCSYEHEYQPVARLPLDVPALLEFALQRAESKDADALHGALSWETYFKTS